MQNVNSDGGEDSTDEKIIKGKFYLFEELEDSIKQLKRNLYINGDKSLLRREIRFKNKNK